MGKLIVIEGGDGAGKETQAHLALETLRSLQPSVGRVTYFDYPRYKTSLTGGIVRRALDGAYGDFRNLDPHLASLPYTLDRVGDRGVLIRAIENGIALCNRYTPSNLMYQAAKFEDVVEQYRFIEFLEFLEYEELKLPKPDLVLYLYVPFEVSRQLAQARGTLDQHEADEAYQRKVINLYRRTAKERPEIWKLVECVEDGQLLTREVIHDRVMNFITPVLEE